MKKKPVVLFLLFLIVSGLVVFFILFSYYRGDRSNFINKTINNFSSDHQELAIELKKFTKILDGLYLFHQFIPSHIPVYSLTIDPKNLMFLNANLPQGEAYLTSEYKKFVPAKFEYQGKIYPVKVRYRGDNENHWRYDKKSWRIKFKDNLEGQTAINLILPEDRYFFIEPWIAHMGKKLGLTLPEFSFINLKVNGQLHGVYLKSEHWGKAFLANHNLPKDADLYGEAEFTLGASNLYTDVNNFQKYTYDPSSKKSDVSNFKLLLDLLNNASDKVFFDSIPEIIDMDNFLKWQTQSTLAFSHSQKASHNLIIYFHPHINKFQFIPWNVAMADEEPVYPDLNYNPLMTRILSHPDYMFQRNLNLWQYVSDQQNLADDLKYYDDLYQNTRGSFYRDSLKIFPNLDFDLTVKKHRQRLIKAQKRIIQLLNDAQAQTKVSLNPDFEPKATAYFEIESSGFASIKLHQIVINSAQPATFSLIKDSNNNQKIDYLDQKLANFQTNINQYSLQPQDIIIHTHRDVQQSNQPFLLKASQQGFFIVSTPKVNLLNLDIELKNAITEDQIKYE